MHARLQQKRHAAPSAVAVGTLQKKDDQLLAGRHGKQSENHQIISDRLNARSSVQMQQSMANDLDQRANVIVQHQACDALNMQSQENAPIQMNGWDLGSLGVGLAGGAYLGSYLDSFVPYKLGSVGGGLLGGLLGYLAPSVVRGFMYGKPWDEVNREDSYRTGRSPQTLADQLMGSSTEFANLRDRAEREVSDTYDKDLQYGGFNVDNPMFPGAYKEENVMLDTAQHPAIMMQHMIFETANAAQAGFFAKVLQDYEDSSVSEKSLNEYGELLGRDPNEIPEKLRLEYEKGSPAERRTLLQEWAEYNSLELARPVFNQVHDQFRSSTAQDYRDKVFDPVLALSDSFESYYDIRGQDHREAVLKALVESEKKKL